MKFAGVISFIPIKELTGPLIKVTAGAKGVEITQWEASFPTTREEGSSLVIISLYLDPSKGSGSSHSHIFPLITSSNNSEEITLKVPRRTHNPDELSAWPL